MPIYLVIGVDLDRRLEALETYLIRQRELIMDLQQVVADNALATDKLGTLLIELGNTITTEIGQINDKLSRIPVVDPAVAQAIEQLRMSTARLEGFSNKVSELGQTVSGIVDPAPVDSPVPAPAPEVPEVPGVDGEQPLP